MSEDIAEQFFHDVMELEESLSAGSAAFAAGSPDDETVNAAFRAVHSLKGTAGFLASDDGRFGTLNKFCHLFENFLDSLRRHARPLDAENCRIAVTSIDALLADLDKMRDGGTPGLHEEMAADFLEKPRGRARRTAWSSSFATGCTTSVCGGTATGSTILAPCAISSSDVFLRRNGERVWS